ncbi:OmpA family protein [Nitrospira sp. Kam-Ns4a]
MTPFICRGLPGLFVVLALAWLVAGCAGRSVSSSAQDLALVPGPPPKAASAPAPPVSEAPLPSAREAEQPPAAPPAVKSEEPAPPPAEKPPEVAAVAPPAPPPPPAQPREKQAEAPVPPPVPEEARVTESAVAPLPAESPKAPPSEVAAVAPAAPPPTVEPLSLSDVFFDFDQFVLRDDARPTLEQNAERLKKQDGWKLLIEGHCDERGTAAYNLVLGERRAQTVRDYLANLGLPAAHMTVTSFGKEKPFCTEHSHACWQQNRRAHFVMEK